MKMSFLLSVAIGIAGVILTAVLWLILSTMNVFADIEGVIQSLQDVPRGGDNFSIIDYVGFGRVVSLTIVIGVIDVILMTAIATGHGVPLQHLLRARRRHPADAHRRLAGGCAGVPACGTRHGRPFWRSRAASGNVSLASGIGLRVRSLARG